ncbi:hypothetical protein C7I87_32485 [Mesorhizobium sp. SARCC-RB16n]|uniref:hypothetical protein n=1 Tax=Mesorhizobium sp. SARCC-RB16n TaxID=2116687 RepID=UPI00122F2E0E|nr:hypothetical protein [Mesorhizobium sp. SARCC-RB16n]KAA3442032.1 hypothetical protein C7I87_32485 [Mesorhizobium sp. SARCC-RB16n]
MPKLTNAADMARSVGIDPKAFRQALRDAKLPWHKRNDDWTVEIDGDEHSSMRTVLVTLLKRKKA